MNDQNLVLFAFSVGVIVLGAWLLLAALPYFMGAMKTLGLL